jgi:hypothetical protein
MDEEIKAQRHRPDGVMLTIYETEHVITDAQAQKLLMDLFGVLLGFFRWPLGQEPPAEAEHRLRRE